MEDLVADHLLGMVEDRLPGDVEVGHGSIIGKEALPDEPTRPCGSGVPNADGRDYFFDCASNTRVSAGTPPKARCSIASWPRWYISWEIAKYRAVSRL